MATQLCEVHCVLHQIREKPVSVSFDCHLLKDCYFQRKRSSRKLLLCSLVYQIQRNPQGNMREHMNGSTQDNVHQCHRFR